MNTNTKRIIILVIAILLVSAILSGICGISSFGIRLLHRVKTDQENTWVLKDDISQISIKSKTAGIRIYPSSDRTAKVVWSGNKNSILSVRVRRGTLSVEEKYDRPWFLRGITSGSEIQVWLPKGTYKDLSVGSDTGSIVVSAGTSFVKADIDSDTGSVEFRAGVRDDLKVSTDTGKITIADVSCQKVEADSDTGSLHLTKVIAADKMDLESDTGSIRLERCDGGSIEIETDTGSVHGTLLSEKVFSAKSGTGRVTVPESSFGGSCSIRSDTGSITIEIVK